MRRVTLKRLLTALEGYGYGRRELRDKVWFTFSDEP
jgi:hypothetical protein